MAKRGETRPWKLHFIWENGVKGVTPFRTQEEATWRADDMREYAKRIESGVTITVTHREAK